MCLQASSDFCFSIIVELSISAIDCSFQFHFHPKFSTTYYIIFNFPCLGWDLEVGDGSVVDNEAALLLVELQQPIHAAVLLELVRLCEHKHHPELVHLTPLDKVLPFLRVLHNVPRHPCGEEPPWQQKKIRKRERLT